MTSQIRKADTSVEKNENGSVTVAAIVPGDGGEYRHAQTFYGFTSAAAEREYRRVVNDKLAADGYV